MRQDSAVVHCASRILLAVALFAAEPSPLRLLCAAGEVGPTQTEADGGEMTDESAVDEEGEAVSVQRPAPFFDYDCDLVNTKSGAVADWNMIYTQVRERIVMKDGGIESDFGMPDEMRYLVEPGPEAEQAELECPLGVLYLRILTFYEAFLNSVPREELVPMADHVQGLLGRFHVYAMALSRWPIFHALENFAPAHQPIRSLFCDGKTGVLDWPLLREQAVRWADLKRQREPDDGSLEPLEYEMADKFWDILKRPAIQLEAQDECEFGVHFVVANQVVGAADRETHHLPPFNSVMDSVVGNVPFAQLASCGWPILEVLVIFADLNKGDWFFGGDRKYLRGYSDWNLRRDELSPLVPSVHDFLSHAWRGEVRSGIEVLARLPAPAHAREVNARVIHREAIDGEPLRPIVRSLVDASMAVAAAAAADAAARHGAGPSRAARRLAYVVLLYGERWSVILGRMVRRLAQLKASAPLLVVAIGEHAAAACRRLASGESVESSHTARSQLRWPRVVCWTPGSQSQVHRFTVIHAMLHLGVDVLYMDMDTFLIRDAVPRVLQYAEMEAEQVEAATSSAFFAASAGPPGRREALFARHADADCINIGVFYLRATPQTAVWMSQYLAWYHDHPFEIDQRGLHVFLGLPSKQLNIAYKPEDLVKVSSGILEDVNEIVIGDVGWHGDLSRLLIFHWCHRPLAQKEEEIGAAYDAGDALEAHGLPLGLALSVVRAAAPGSPWQPVLRFRDILEHYRKAAPPERTPCW